MCHYMGPNGVHSLLCEMHTLCFNTLQVQYLEAVFELVHGWQAELDKIQTTMHHYFDNVVPSFGNFTNPQKYAGFVPSEYYLAKMLLKAMNLMPTSIWHVLHQTNLPLMILIRYLFKCISKILDPEMLYRLISTSQR